MVDTTPAPQERISNYSQLSDVAKKRVEEEGYESNNDGQTASRRSNSGGSSSGSSSSGGIIQTTTPNQETLLRSAQAQIEQNIYNKATPKQRAGLIDIYSGVKGLGAAQQQIIDNIHRKQLEENPEGDYAKRNRYYELESTGRFYNEVELESMSGNMLVRPEIRAELNMILESRNRTPTARERIYETQRYTEGLTMPLSAWEEGPLIAGQNRLYTVQTRTINDIPMPKLLSRDAGSRLNIEADKLSFKGMQEDNQLKQLGFKAGAVGLSAAGVVGNVVLHPIQAAKGAVLFPFLVGKEAVTGLPGPGMQFGEKLNRAPEQAFGEIGGMILTGKALGSVYRASPVKLEVIEMSIPRQGTTSIIGKGTEALKVTTVPEPITYTGVGVKLFNTGKVIIGKTDTGLVKGTPKLDLSSADLSGGFIGETASSRTIIRNSLSDIVKPDELTRFDLTMDIIGRTETTRSSFVSKSLGRETQTLGVKGVDTVIKATKKEGGQLYGSFPSRAQMPADLWQKTRGNTSPADIDVFINKDMTGTELFSQKLLNDLTAKGETVRITKENPLLIESKVDGTWRHAVDIHSNEATTDILSPSVAQDSAWGFRFNQGNIKIEGVKSMKLSEQGVRKGASITTLRQVGGEVKFAPEAHRMKDIGDFIGTQETLIQSKLFGRGKALGKLEQLKQMYPKEIVEAGRVKLDFRSARTGRKGSSSLLTSASTGISASVDIISPNRSMSPSPSIFRSPSSSMSRSPSQSSSQSSSMSPSPSNFRSPSPSSSRSPSPSPSPSSFRSPFPSLSPSLSVSPSPSPYQSSSLSISPSPSPGLITPSLLVPPILGGGIGGFGNGNENKSGEGRKRKFAYSSSIAAQFLNIKATSTNPKTTGIGIRGVQSPNIGKARKVKRTWKTRLGKSR